MARFPKFPVANAAQIFPRGAPEEDPRLMGIFPVEIEFDATGGRVV